jgi:hypothetical protein
MPPVPCSAGRGASRGALVLQRRIAFRVDARSAVPVENGWDAREKGA